MEISPVTCLVVGLTNELTEEVVVAVMVCVPSVVVVACVSFVLVVAMVCVPSVVVVACVSFVLNPVAFQEARPTVPFLMMNFL